MSKLDVNENMKIGIDLKTIGQIVSLVVAGATMWFTLKGDVSSIELKMDAISEKVDRMYNNTSMEVIETKLESYDEKFEDNKDLVKELRDIPSKVDNLQSLSENKADKVHYHSYAVKKDIKNYDKAIDSLSSQINKLKSTISGLEKKNKNTGSAF